MLWYVALFAVYYRALALPQLPNFLTKSLADHEKADKPHPDIGLTVIELILKYGYPVERHQNILTEDGYLLEMQRIPYGKQSGPAKNKPVVFLMHGVLLSSADWVNMGPEKSIAYLLADMGYDVWMGNARGNTWSRHHITYDPDNDKADFWTFSWNEIGVYDLPAMIDYVLQQTGQNKLSYIGHSQGTTVFWVMASEKPAYNDKIKIMVALAPTAYMSNMKNPLLQLISVFDNILVFIDYLLRVYELAPNRDFFTDLGTWACVDGAVFQGVCAGVIFLIGGFDSDQLNRTMIPVIMTSTPASISTKQLLHYSQEINSGFFRKYDFGLIQNLIQYGSVSPPDYILSNVKAPVGLFYSSNDWAVDVVDVRQLMRELPNVVKDHLVPYDTFNHLDFIWAIDIIPLLYNDVFALLEQYK